MTRYTIAVSGTNAVDNPGPGVAIIRSLKEADFDVHSIGLAYDVLEPGNYLSSIMDANFILPYPSAGPDALWNRVQEIHKKMAIDILIPALDSELENFIHIQDRLKLIGIKTFLPEKKSLLNRDKKQLFETMKNGEVELPLTFSIQDVNAFENILGDLDFPVYIKGVYYDAYLARNLTEAQGYFHRIASRWGLPVIVQQYIKGEEYNIAALSQNGNVKGRVCMKKMYLTDKGKAWAGVTIANEKLLRISDNILKNLNWNSGCELEFLIEEKTNRIYLLEINPRFPAWIYLATRAGQNLPQMLSYLALGKELEFMASYEIGTVFIRRSWDDIVNLSDIEKISVSGEIIRNKLRESNDK